MRTALERAGCDSVALFRAAGLDVALLADPEARYPLSGTTRLWQLAVAATGDSAFGLRVASQISPASAHAVGFALPTSATLKDAFQRIARYSRIVTDVGSMELRDHGDEFHVLISTPANAPRPADEAVDAFVSVQVRMSRALLDREVSPLRIELCRGVPRERYNFEQILRAPLYFCAAHNLIAFDQATANRPLDGANPLLARNYDDVAQKVLADLDQARVLRQVRDELIQRLPEGEPSQEDIATALNVSTRSLQRRLAENGSSYRELLDDTRRELALGWLRHRACTVTEVTCLLGFSGISSFTRAFRRWTGQSPSEYRRSYIGQ